jgi:hypothetical protein
MLFAILLGNRMRKKFWHAEEGDAKGGVNSLLGALFGLWSFILAFTFGQSGTRFETVRAMIVDEGNILRSAILKADFFPDSVRDAYRIDLKKYLEERIAYYEDDADEAKFLKNRAALSETATALWTRTVALSKRPETSGPADDMAPALTGLFDIGIKREAFLNAGIPMPINIMLVVLALSISLVGGFTTPTIKRKEWIVITVFALLARIPCRELVACDAFHPVQFTRRFCAHSHFQPDAVRIEEVDRLAEPMVLRAEHVDSGFLQPTLAFVQRVHVRHFEGDMVDPVRRVAVTFGRR